jgi:hypothetical protein
MSTVQDGVSLAAKPRTFAECTSCGHSYDITSPIEAGYDNPTTVYGPETDGRCTVCFSNGWTDQSGTPNAMFGWTKS